MEQASAVAFMPATQVVAISSGPNDGSLNCALPTNDNLPFSPPGFKPCLQRPFDNNEQPAPHDNVGGNVHRGQHLDHGAANRVLTSIQGWSPRTGNEATSVTCGLAASHSVKLTITRGFSTRQSGDRRIAEYPL